MESHDEIRLRVFALTAEPFSGWALDRGMNGFPMSFSEECRLGSHLISTGAGVSLWARESRCVGFSLVRAFGFAPFAGDIGLRRGRGGNAVPAVG
jgi:hypothetical protein